MLNFKWTLPVALTSLSLFSPNSYAEQSYQTELYAGYEKTDADTSTDKTALLAAQIFFSPVNTENKPLAAAAFLDKSGSIAIGYVKSKTELQNINFSSIDTNGPLIEINYITETDAFILGAAYSKLDFDTDDNQATGESKAIGVNIGKYLDDSSTLEFSYFNNDIEARNTTSNRTSSTDIKRYKLSYQTVQPLGTTSFYGFEAIIGLIKKDSASAKEDNRELDIAGQYYFTRMTSLEAVVSFNSGDDVSREGNTLEINATHFFMPQIAFNLGLSRFYADDSQTEDTDSIFIEALARF